MLLTNRPTSGLRSFSKKCLVIATGRRLKLQQLDQTASLQTLAAERMNYEGTRMNLPNFILHNSFFILCQGSGYCTTIADALAHLRSCPQGNDPLEFIFGDLLARFTPEEERIVATLSYPTEPIPVAAIAEISGVDEPTTRRALKLQNQCISTNTRLHEVWQNSDVTIRSTRERSSNTENPPLPGLFNCMLT